MNPRTLALVIALMEAQIAHSKLVATSYEVILADPEIPALLRNEFEGYQGSARYGAEVLSQRLAALKTL